MLVKSILPINHRQLAARKSGWLIINPEYRELFELHHLATPNDVLDLPGIVVNGHVNRNVSQVHLGEMTAFLKREHRVKTRTRWKNFLAGFGLVSMSEREVQVLKFLDAQNLCGPDWMAYGSVYGVSFLLVRGVEGTSKPVIQSAKQIARLHLAGVDQPDLYFKHVLGDSTGNVTILDWQQARLRHKTNWLQRTRSLAALLATTPSGVPKTERLRFLKTYWAEFSDTERGNLEFSLFARQIINLARELRKKSSIRRQISTKPDTKQLLVRIQGETVCAIPEVADDLKHGVIIQQLHDHTRTVPPAMLPVGTTWIANRYRNLAILVRGETWRAPELKTARLLMHLERHGIAAPKIVAYGQRIQRMSATAFVAYSSAEPTLMPLPELIRRLHEVGVVLKEPNPSSEPFRFENGHVLIHDPRCFRLVKKLSWKDVEHANHWLKISEAEM